MSRNDDAVHAAEPRHAPAAATVLIVEDRALLRDAVQLLLDRAGFATLAAGSAEDALRLLHEHPDIALLLTDVGLPGQDGWALAAAARALRCGLPVLYMSGHAAESWAARGVPDSMFLQKPFALDELVACVARLARA